MTIAAFEIDDLRKAGIVDERFECSDFEVNAANYDPNCHSYYCENSHNCPEPALYLSGASYNPKDGYFEMRGFMVYQCHICKSPVFIDEDS